jgi:peptidoglycan/LPS O-acetylase OafA/YrhL
VPTWTRAPPAPPDDSRRISLATFRERRARRILPALLAVLAMARCRAALRAAML